MKKICICAIVLTIFLSGCGQKNTSAPRPQAKVVTGITVTYENGPISAQRFYTSSSKMRAILNYLRWIDPYGLPEEDPEVATGGSFRITLSYSDGKQKQYLQKADRYLLEDGQGWKRIDPDRAMTLSRILGEMASDP